VRSPLSLNLYWAGRGASALGGTGNRPGRRHAEAGERRRTSSRAGPRVRVVLVCRPHSMPRVFAVERRREPQGLLRGEYPALRRSVWHRAGFRYAQAQRVAANLVLAEVCLHHAGPHLFSPIALHSPLAWRPASTLAGLRSLAWRVFSILLGLRAEPALAAGPVQVLVRAPVRARVRVWAGGRWVRMRERPAAQQANPGELLPGSFSAWVSAPAAAEPPSPQEQKGQPPRRTRASRFPGSSKSARPWRGYGSGAWRTSRAPLPAPASAR
jgi:hypothetical protein